MVDGGLDYSIRKKLDTYYLEDMAQLAYRVHQVEHLKVEKGKINKYHKKEKVSYKEADNYPTDAGGECVDENEVNMVELKL